MNRRKSYDMNFKIAVSEDAKNMSNRAAAIKYNVSEKMVSFTLWHINISYFTMFYVFLQVRDWKSKVNEMKQFVLVKNMKKNNKQRRRLDGGGKSIKNSDGEYELAMWVMYLREQHIPVTRFSIAEEAKRIFNIHGFKASSGWIDNFMMRWNFSLRRPTSIGQTIPKDFLEKVVGFLKLIKHLVSSKQISESHIGNMDETSICFEMSPHQIIHLRGEKSVPINTHVNTRQHFTVVLCAMADGRTLPPLVIFKGTRALNINVPNVSVIVSPTGWMTSEIMIKWLTTVWTNFAFGERLLILDSFRGHLTDGVSECLRKFNTTRAVIPGGCTKHLQPADKSWIALFKARYRQLFNQWLVDTSECLGVGSPFTKPDKELMVNWVKLSWESIPRKTICSSFKVCGLIPSDDFQSMELLRDPYLGSNLKCALGLISMEHKSTASSSMDPLLARNYNIVDLDESFGD
jgi:hypothetical protein